jgi:uncharacterized repeat protein (TIGR01451 family)
MKFIKHFPNRQRDRLRCRLHLEPLEDRVTPSQLGLFDVDDHVNIWQDSSALAVPQLQIVKSVTDGFPDVIHPGDTASFTITVTNNYGGGDALNVVVTDQLPAADLLFWSAASSAFTTSVSTGDFLTATMSRLPAGATATILVTASIPVDIFGPPFPVPPASRLPSGPFELDGNATTGVLGASGSATPSRDWDRIFLDVVNRTSTSGAIAGSFVTDAVKSPRDDIFTGRSRDTQGIQAGPWRFQESKPQALNDISHAYAATYVDPSTDHVLLYAGLDRYDNSGDATAGFWFFRNLIGENATLNASGGLPFTGEHADGDILLVSDFTQGGGASAIQVFRWTGDDSTGSLVPITAPEGATFAIVNDAPITVPWSYSDKSHHSGPAAGEFLEEGVDLTALGLDGCFSSFLAETRSSQSPTATLSDFVIGTFNSCRLELPNTATVQADGIDPIASNFALITVLHEDAGEKLVPVDFSLEELSSVPMFLAAESLGITQIAGKDISGSGSPPGNAQAKTLEDVGIGVDPILHENEPTVAANPKDKKHLVAASHLATPGAGPVIVDVRITIFRSEDGGATWSGPVLADRLPGAIFSSDPVLAYTPDGSRVYLAYLDEKDPADGTRWDILVSHSDDNGATWSTPVIALRAQPGFFGYDKPWIDADNSHVYVTATKFGPGRSRSIALASSSDKGASFPNSAAPVLLDTVLFPRLVEGARPTVGPNGEVLVAWYDSGPDGPFIGSFEINTARSGNFAASFDPSVVAVTDSFELPYWLGPFASYHRWWAGMLPDVEIDAKGDAHIVYAHDPVANPLFIPGIPGGVSTTPEDGDIRYITSSGPSFTTWSSPVTVNDDASGTAQGFPALEIQNGDTLHVIWEDHRLSSTDNLYYDIFYSRKLPGQGVGWSTNFRVSDASSISDFIFVGDYIDLTSNSTLLFGVWTDRRHQTSIVAYEDNVFGSRIIAGGAAPSSASALASDVVFIPASLATDGTALFSDSALLHPGGMAEPFLAPGGSLGDPAGYFAAMDFLKSRANGSASSQEERWGTGRQPALELRELGPASVDAVFTVKHEDEENVPGVLIPERKSDAHGEDAPLGANFEGSALAPVTPADSLIGGSFQSARGSSLRGANLPMRPTNVLAGIVAPRRVFAVAARDLGRRFCSNLG